MVPTRFRLLSLAFVAILVLNWLPSLAAACPFCEAPNKPTMIEDFQQASMVLFGKFANPKVSSEGDFDGGTTDFVIEKTLKDKNKFVAGKKKLTIARYVPSRNKYLLFVDVFKGKIDPFRGVEITTNADIVKYLEGARKLKDKSIPARLRYCFDYLDNPELEISMDAYREFAKADYKDYRDMAKKLPADKIAGWLKNPRTPTYRYGLYASLLGHSGKVKHARLLRDLLDNHEKRVSGTGTDGMLVAYTLLDKEHGWKYIRGLLGNPKEDFQLRYAGLRTVRFFWDTRPDVVTKKERADALCLLLGQADIADFAIEDLRKWNVWEAADKVLDLTKKESHNLPVIRRAVLRYALSCPKKNARAAAYLKAERKKDKENVEQVEEMLKFDTEAPPK